MIEDKRIKTPWLCDRQTCWLIDRLSCKGTPILNVATICCLGATSLDNLPFFEVFCLHKWLNEPSLLNKENLQMVQLVQFDGFYLESLILVFYLTLSVLGGRWGTM